MNKSPDRRHDGVLEGLSPGQPVPFGGNRVAFVSDDLASAFRLGDHLVVVQETGALLHIPASEQAIATEAVDRAVSAFGALASVSDEAITVFFDAMARRLEDDSVFAPVSAANAADVASAQSRGRSTTRLELTVRMRADMVAALRMWRDLPGGRNQLVESVPHEGWRVEVRRNPLGVVGFVFEGRPNVFADATGVLRSGNSVVFRIGSDALGTARAIVDHVLHPALAEAGLPDGAVGLIDASSHAAGWALFSDRRLSLAVARGSGRAVAELGAVARQAGVPVSLHGTGGAWLVAGDGANPASLSVAAVASLDRKVCNTMNVCCVPAARATELVPVVLAALVEAGNNHGTTPVLHVVRGSEAHVGAMEHHVIDVEDLATEWEWEDRPEVSLVVVDDVDHAVALCNEWSPRFVASLISDDDAEQERFWSRVDAPFVGNGFTRWVDGQYALDRPELGLSNWQHGRLFARGGVLSGDGVHTVRLRAVQSDATVRR